MSVTITIEGNNNYCRKNNLFVEHNYTCPQCAGNIGNTLCKECSGVGWASYKVNQYELDMTKEDFSDFLATMGLTDRAVDGRIWAQRMIDRLAGLVDMIHEDDMEKPIDTDRSQPAAQYQKVCTYVIECLELCQEAIRREEMVVWQTH